MWDLPRPGLEPVSPALAGRFSTTAPSGKPQRFSFDKAVPQGSVPSTPPSASFTCSVDNCSTRTTSLPQKMQDMLSGGQEAGRGEKADPGKSVEDGGVAASFSGGSCGSAQCADFTQNSVGKCPKCGPWGRRRRASKCCHSIPPFCVSQQEPGLRLYSNHTHVHTHTRARTHMHTHARTHTHDHLFLWPVKCPAPVTLKTLPNSCFYSCFSRLYLFIYGCIGASLLCTGFL